LDWSVRRRDQPVKDLGALGQALFAPFRTNTAWALELPSRQSGSGLGRAGLPI